MLPPPPPPPDFFETLTEYIFRRVYGLPSEELSLEKNSKLKQKIIAAVNELRESYKLRESYRTNVCVTDYSKEENRKAYMIAYYPYFFAAVQNIVFDLLNKDYLAQRLKQQKKLYCEYFAGGPCPELLGTALAVNGFAKKNSLGEVSLDCAAYDFEKGWSDLRSTVTYEFCNDEIKLPTKGTFFSGFDIENFAQELREIYDTMPTNDYWKNIKARMANTDVVFLQNYLSHISGAPQSVRNFLDWFANLVRLTPYGTFFVLVDLKYGATYRVFDTLTNDADFLGQTDLDVVNELSHTHDDGDAFTITHPLPSAGIEENIFYDPETGSSTLKRKTNYFQLVLLKAQP